jgi:hypothetical protein
MVFGDFRSWLWNLAHLITLGMRVFPQQQRATVGVAHHDPLHALNRLALASMSRMPFLSPTFAPGRLGLGMRKHSRTIQRRRRLKGVLRIPIDLFPQMGHFRFKPSDLLMLLGYPIL